MKQLMLKFRDSFLPAPRSQTSPRRTLHKTRFLFLCILLALWLVCTAAAPRQDGYSIVVNKTVGFNNGSQIRGSFRAQLVGPNEGISAVRFLVDGQVFAEVFKPPFTAAFQTSDYSEGWHTIAAQVETTGGQVITTPERRLNFVSAQAETDFMRNLVFPLLGGVFALMLVSFGVRFLAVRGRPNRALPLGARRSYGLKGGGICPRCHRPFGLHWWSINLISGVYDRCDYCGRWGFLRAASASELASAEAAEAAGAQPDEPVREKSEEEKLKELLDNSRYNS
jgi:hypothetical protein